MIDAQAFEALKEYLGEDADKILATPFSVTAPADCPYSFEAKTIGDAVAVILEDRRYWNRYDVSPLAWNVKAYRYDVNGDDSEGARDKTLDSAWEKYLESHAGQWVHEHVFEMAQEYYRHDWSSYPGEDQGDWEMEFWGRQGGHLVVTKWKGYKIEGKDRHEWGQFVGELVLGLVEYGRKDFADLYRGVVTADRDLTPESASKEVTHHYGFRRLEWEEERQNFAEQLKGALIRAAEKCGDEFGVDVTAGDVRKAIGLWLDTVENYENAF